MQIVGITGGIGTGKSVVTKILRAMGYPVYDSDVEARRIMHQDTTVARQLRDAFGDTVFINGLLDRQRLAREVFDNDQRLQLLNGIVHPAVKNDFRSWAQAQTSPLVFLESAILFESGFDSETDKSILVTAPMETRIERVVNRDRCSREQVLKRMAQQWPEDKKAALVDFIIANDDSDPLILQTERIISQLIPSSFRH